MSRRSVFREMAREAGWALLVVGSAVLVLAVMAASLGRFGYPAQVVATSFVVAVIVGGVPLVWWEVASGVVEDRERGTQ